jgi:hypothetical protein
MFSLNTLDWHLEFNVYPPLNSEAINWIKTLIENYNNNKLDYDTIITNESEEKNNITFGELIEDLKLESYLFDLEDNLEIELE